MKPVIGILAHPPYTFEKNPYNQIGCNYTDSIYKAGGIPIVIPQIDDMETIQGYVDIIDGLLIPGGIDINPMMYHEDPLPKLGTVNIKYDTWQFHVLDVFKKTNKPILGICRGLQMLNVYHGGTLYQDNSYRENTFLHNQTEDRGSASHSIHISQDTHLSKLFGESLDVNSFHHQMIKDLASNFIVSATANDGVIEAIEDPTYPYMIGVQWHPEGFVHTNDSMMPLFTDFIENCKK